MQKHKRTLIDNLFLVLKGIAMGAANKVPGVSGGVVSFVMGFYDEFIYSLQRVNKIAFSILLRGEFKNFYSYINGTFLSLITLGTIVSFFSVSKLIDYLLISYELYVWATFFGMIVGSVYYIYRDFGNWTTSNIFFLIFGISIGILISIPDPMTENRNLFFVLLCGMISTSGMALPGLSGSFILMLLGNYVLLLVDSVNALGKTIFECLTGDFTFINQPDRLELLLLLAIFVFGSILGLVLLSHVLGFVLKRHKKTTYALIIGFILGSLGVVWPWKNKIITENGVTIGFKRFIPDVTVIENILGLAYILLGILIVYFLESYGKRNK